MEEQNYQNRLLSVNANPPGSDSHSNLGLFKEIEA
jgi:hypothetical protein